MWNISQGCITGTPAPTPGPPSATCAERASLELPPMAYPVKVLQHSAFVFYQRLIPQLPPHGHCAVVREAGGKAWETCLNQDFSFVLAQCWTLPTWDWFGEIVLPNLRIQCSLEGTNYLSKTPLSFVHSYILVILVLIDRGDQCIPFRRIPNGYLYCIIRNISLYLRFV